MTEKWTCSDLGRAIMKRRTETPPPSHEEAAPDALMTLAKLLTGAGGPIDDAEVRRLEGWLDEQGRRTAGGGA